MFNTRLLPIVVEILKIAMIQAKVRSWIGPTQLIQGFPPFPRDSYGFTTVGELIFVYGGIGNSIGITLKYFFLNNFFCLLESVI